MIKALKPCDEFLSIVLAHIFDILSKYKKIIVVKKEFHKVDQHFEMFLKQLDIRRNKD